jgi:flavin-binding protein dodecin
VGTITRVGHSLTSMQREHPWPTGRRPDDDAVGVQKAIDLIGTGDSIQDAVSEALDRARLSLEGITSFEVQRISGAVDGAAAAYEVQLRVWFTLLERMHG